MAVIAAISDSAFAARSASFKVQCGAGPDTLDFSVIAAAMLAADPTLAWEPSAIYEFLTTSHTDADGTLKTLSANGGLISAISTLAVTTVSGDNQLTFTGGASSIAVRISLGSSIAS